MRTFLLGLLATLFVFAAMSSCNAYGKSLLDDSNLYNYQQDIMKVEELSVEHKKYTTRRDPYYYEDSWQNQSTINLRLGIMKVMYFNAKLNCETMVDPVRAISTEYTAGVRITKWLDVIKYYSSEHVLDHNSPSRFPIQSAYGIKVNIITSDK